MRNVRMYVCIVGHLSGVRTTREEERERKPRRYVEISEECRDASSALFETTARRCEDHISYTHTYIYTDVPRGAMNSKKSSLTRLTDHRSTNTRYKVHNGEHRDHNATFCPAGTYPRGTWGIIIMRSLEFLSAREQVLLSYILWSP